MDRQQPARQTRLLTYIAIFYSYGLKHMRFNTPSFFNTWTILSGSNKNFLQERLQKFRLSCMFVTLNEGQGHSNWYVMVQFTSAYHPINFEEKGSYVSRCKLLFLACFFLFCFWLLLFNCIFKNYFSRLLFMNLNQEEDKTEINTPHQKTKFIKLIKHLERKLAKIKFFRHDE